MSLKPMGQAEILMALIDKAIKDMEVVRKEVSATLPSAPKRSMMNEIIDPRTGKPFTLRKSKYRHQTKIPAPQYVMSSDKSQGEHARY